MRASRFVGAGLMLAMALLMPRAWAMGECAGGGAESVRDRAKAHYTAGLAAYQEGEYSEAVDHLSCANQLLPSPDFSYNIALTYEAMGDVSTALRWYREHGRMGDAAGDTRAQRAKVAELEAMLQLRGLQQVTVISVPPGATLSIDDQPAGIAPFTVDARPGRHKYRLSLGGHESVQGVFELRPDRSLDVRAELTAQTAPVASAPAGAAPVKVTPTDAGQGKAIGTWTWVSLGAGTLLLGGALAAEWRRSELDRDLIGTSQVDYQGRYDTMTTYQTTARVFLASGTLALVAGGVLAIFDANREPVDGQLELSTCTEGDVCVAASGAF